MAYLRKSQVYLDILNKAAAAIERRRRAPLQWRIMVFRTASLSARSNLRAERRSVQMSMKDAPLEWRAPSKSEDPSISVAEKRVLLRRCVRRR